MIEHTINPVLIEIGSFEIRYYGLIYLVGLFLGYLIINSLKEEFGINLTREQVLDYVIYLAFGLLIGARLFYFVFYHPWVFWEAPLDVLKLWQGGMSFHGGLIGAVIAGIIFCRRYGLPVYKMADLTIIPTALALAFGRLGNFINGELYGRVWEGGFLCVDYSNNTHLQNPPEGCRYPSQILESMKNLLIFGTLLVLKNKRFPDGFLFWMFVGMYGFFRFLIEFVRMPDPQIGLFFGFLTMGQLLCILMMAVSSFMIFRMKAFK